jgi:hypothetical protein
MELAAGGALRIARWDADLSKSRAIQQKIKRQSDGRNYGVKDETVAAAGFGGFVRRASMLDAVGCG